MFGDILTGPTAHLRAEPIMTLLPGPAGERSVPLFEHGSLIVKLYAPRGHDPQTPHTRDELYVVAQGHARSSMARRTGRLGQPTSFSLPPGRHIGSRRSPMVSRCG